MAMRAALISDMIAALSNCLLRVRFPLNPLWMARNCLSISIRLPNCRIRWMVLSKRGSMMVFLPWRMPQPSVGRPIRIKKSILATFTTTTRRARHTALPRIATPISGLSLQIPTSPKPFPMQEWHRRPQTGR